MSPAEQPPRTKREEKAQRLFPVVYETMPQSVPSLEDMMAMFDAAYLAIRSMGIQAEMFRGDGNYASSLASLHQFQEMRKHDQGRG